MFGSLMLLPGIASSNDALFLTGAEVTTSSSTYFYLGTSVPLPDSTLAKGFVINFWADYLTYNYDAGAIEIEADVISVSATIGYHDSGLDYWWSTSVGPIQSDTNLTPDDSGNDSSGMQLGAKFQLEGGLQLTPYSKITGNLTLLSKRSAYWARMRFLSRNDDDTYHGPELIVQGDANYEVLQLGWVLVHIPLNNDWDFGVKGGLRLDDGFRLLNTDISGYAGIELSVLY